MHNWVSWSLLWSLSGSKSSEFVENCLLERCPCLLRRFLGVDQALHEVKHERTAVRSEYNNFVKLVNTILLKLSLNKIDFSHLRSWFLLGAVNVLVKCVWFKFQISIEDNRSSLPFVLGHLFNLDYWAIIRILIKHLFPVFIRILGSLCFELPAEPNLLHPLFNHVGLFFYQGKCKQNFYKTKNNSVTIPITGPSNPISGHVMDYWTQ